MNPLIHKKISIIGDCKIVKAATLPYCGATLNTVAEMDIDISPNRVLRVWLETSHIVHQSCSRRPEIRELKGVSVLWRDIKIHACIFRPKI